MTVIAWDGKTLAADKLFSHGSLQMTGTKIQKIGAALVGFSGDASIAAELIEWFSGGCAPEKFPATQRNENLSELLVVWPNGDVHKYQRSPLPVKFPPQKCAIGSGRDFAIAAMHLGQTARQAVEIASIYDTDCGNGVDVLSFG